MPDLGRHRARHSEQCDGGRAARYAAIAVASTDTRTEHDDPLDIAPHRELLGQVLDKWSLVVMGELCERPCRFNELRRAIPDVTQKSLTATLRRLERNGLIERELLSSRPVAVEYRITPLGKTARAPIDALIEWAERSAPMIERARDAFDGAQDAAILGAVRDEVSPA